ncbi:MAG: hypothetical protein AAB434_11525 [Planctomycetota bacterium]
MRRLAPYVLLPALAASLRAEEALVHTELGEIPIVLTAPHGGKQHIPGVPDRESGVTTRDMATYEIVIGIAEELEKRLGERPYLVAALFHRASADANRGANDAFEDEDAKPHYDAYHDAVANVVADVQKRWPGRGLLLDIHGQAAFEGIHRGTKDGRTVRRLVKRIGEEAFVGPEGLLGRLAAKDYEVFPPVGKPLGSPEEDARFNGGYTVRTYGSDHEDGIDAIQLEFGPKLRTDEKRREKLVRDLAEAIAGFYKDALAK